MKKFSLVGFLGVVFLLVMSSSLQAADIVVDSKDNSFKAYSELLSGEKIDLHLGEVKHYLETVSIEGNGLPIKLGHSFRTSGYGGNHYKEVFLQVPELTGMTPRGERNYNIDDGSGGDGSVTISPYLNAPNSLFKCSQIVLPTDAATSVLYSDHYDGYEVNNLNDLISSFLRLKIGLEYISFFPKRYASSSQSSRFPSNASFISASNWYIQCATSPGIAGDSVFKVVSPNGLIYTFDPYKEYRKTGLAADFYPNMKVSSVTDKYGNRLDYSYTSITTGRDPSIIYPDLQYLLTTKFRIKSISANDGRKVDITYSVFNSSNFTIKSNSTTNPVNLTYVSSTSGSEILTTITRKDGKFWRYRHSNTSEDIYTGGKLKSVEYPNGLKVAYVYLGGLLKKRTVSGSGINNVQDYSYHSTGGNLRTNTTFVKSLNQSIEYKYKNIYFVNNPLDTPINTGRIISKTIFPTGTVFAQRTTAFPLKKVEYEYTREGKVIDLDYLKSNWSVQYGWDNMIGLLEGTHHSYRTKISKKTTQINGYTFTTDYDYDPVYGQLKTITESNTLGDSRITRRTYHNDSYNWIIGKLESESIDGESAKSTFAYNSKGALTRKTINGIQETYTYHNDGNLYQINQYKNGSALPVSTFTDYYRGIARNTTDGENNTKRTEVYDFGQVKSETDFNGNPATYYEYDAIHRLKKINPPGSRSTTFIYWPTELKKITTQGSYKQTIDYNAMMQPTLVTEEDVGRNEKIYTKTTYDSGGRIDVSSFPSASSNDGVGRKYTYDGLGRPKTITHTVDNSATSFCYGSSCGYGTKHGTRVTDARGYRTIKNYRAYGNPNNKNLISIKEQKIGSAYITTTISRGKHGQITNINQGGKNRTFEYQAGTLLLSKKTDPEIGITGYYYDARGNISQKEVGSAISTYYNYDNNNRIEHINYPGSTLDVSYKYSGSNLEKITTGSNNTVLDYLYWANSNDIKYETLTIDGLRFVTYYQYDNLGNLDSTRLPSIEYPSSARVIDSTVDALGRTRDIAGFVSGVQYHPNGTIKRMEYGNGQILNGSLNSKRLPSKLSTTRLGQNIVNLNYYYDRNNNVTNIVDTVQGGNNRSMGYDGLNRMTTANGRWGGGSIVYNDNHDIDTLILGNKTLYYGYNNSGKLTHTTGSINKNFTYDNYGNVSANGTDNFIYDDANQMLKVSNQNINYTYDGNKKRVKVQTPEKTVYYFYNLAGELLYRYDKTNKKDIEYINLNGKLIAKFESLGIPNAPTLISPVSSITDNTPVFTWNAVSGATEYYILVNHPAGLYGSPISLSTANCASGTGVCSYTVPSNFMTFESGFDYTWQVNAKNGGGTSDWSPLLTFSINSSGGTSNTSLNETNISGVTGQYIHYTIEVPAGATALDVNLSNVTGDPELLVSYGVQPTISINDCSSENGAGGNESCLINNPQAGTWHIAVYGYADFSGTTLTANTTVGSTSGTGNTSLNESNISGVTGQYIHYTIEVPAGATALDVNLSNVTGDPELLVSYGVQPTISINDCSSENGAGGNESCLINNPQVGTWHIAVYGYADFSGTTLTANTTVGSTSATGNTSLNETNISGGYQEYKYYTIDVPAGATALDVNLTNVTGDPELYVRYEAQPTTLSHQCGSENSPDTNENCRVDNPLAGTWHIAVYGASGFSGATLTASSQ